MSESLVENQAMPGAASQNSGQQGKMFTQDEVNYLTSKVRDSAYEKARQEAQAQQQAAPAGMSKDEVMQLLNETLAQKETNFSALNTVQKFNEGMAKGPSDYSDFAAVTSRIDLQSAPQLVSALADVPDAHDVMYELCKKPSKLADVQSLLLMNQHKAARALIDEIRESAAENKQAKAKADATREPAPLNILKATQTQAGGSFDVPTTQSDMKQALFALRQKRQGMA